MPAPPQPGLSPEEIHELQGTLKDVGFDPGPPNGRLEPRTRRALVLFQKKNGLTADGEPGPETLAALRTAKEQADARKSMPVDQKRRARPPVEKRADPPPESDDVSETTRTVQGQLRALGFYDAEPTGRMNRETMDAVRRFQAANDLPADGFPGSLTLTLLERLSSEPVEQPEEAGEPVTRGLRTHVTRVSADSVEGVDLLDRRSRVECLASVIATKQLETPLAIGLFGDWGSGKSFFMRRVQDRIVELTEASVQAEAEGRPSYYCSHVRQVSFNAWLYADSDIWPSFAAEVFRSVSGVDTEAPQGELQTLHLRDYQRGLADDLHQRQAEGAQAATDAEGLERRIDELTNEIADRQTKLAASGAELAPEAAATARAIGDAGVIVRGIRRIGPAWREMSGRDLALVLAPVAVAIAFALLAVVRPGWSTVAASLFFAVCALLTVVARGVRHLDETTRLKNEVRNLEEARAELVRERDENAKAKGKADEKLGSARAVPLLPQFAEAQAARWLSREQLGIVTEIRLAFDGLSRLITASRRARTLGQPPAQEPLPIDRVIVYIDDLDRCQHDVVVRVLETLKLLLSQPNFVVVVGVDSRWLFRSLEVHFDALLSPNERASADVAWAATPQNYLEKIFQYSMVLKPIGSEGFGRLIDHMLLDDPTTSGGDDSPLDTPAEHGDAEPTSVPADGTGFPSPGYTPPAGGGYEAPDRPPADAPSVDLLPNDLLITPAEREFIKTLAPMFNTPRAAKRLANVYRLLRVTVGADRVLDRDSYEPVLLLLAIGIGFPGLAGELFRGLARTTEMLWVDFVKDLRPRNGESPGSFENAVADDLTREQADGWAEVASVLVRVAPDAVADLETTSLIEWIPVVAEFSFHPWQELLATETQA